MFVPSIALDCRWRSAADEEDEEEGREEADAALAVDAARLDADADANAEEEDCMRCCAACTADCSLELDSDRVVVPAMALPVPSASASVSLIIPCRSVTAGQAAELLNDAAPLKSTGTAEREERPNGASTAGDRSASESNGRATTAAWVERPPADGLRVVAALAIVLLLVVGADDAHEATGVTGGTSEAVFAGLGACTEDGAPAWIVGTGLTARC